MRKITFILLILLGLFLLSSVIAGIVSNKEISLTERILVIPIEGVITYDSGSSGFLGFSSKSKLQNTIEEINDANKDDNVKGVIFEINSPGGSVVASQELANTIKSLKKPKYAVIKEVGASGGYWAASATDKIYASELSVTGSIGVISSYLQFSGLFEKYGITYERLVTGEYKDLGSPFKELTNNERTKLQAKLDRLHQYFVREVSINRNIPIEKVQELATGEFYLGSEAKEFGLIDEFGDLNVAIKDMKLELGSEEIEVEKYEEELSFFDLFSARTSYYFGKGVASGLLEFKSENNLKISA